MPPQGRLGDISVVPKDAHNCPGCPHACVGPAVMGSPDVMVNGRPALRVGDMGIHAACCSSNTWTAKQGSTTVAINGKPAHRLSDMDDHCGGTGMLVMGSPDVIVGGGKTFAIPMEIIQLAMKAVSSALSSAKADPSKTNPTTGNAGGPTTDPGRVSSAKGVCTVKPDTMVKPVDAPMTSNYGMRVHPVTGATKMHQGVDFGAAGGTPIHAAAPGRVSEVTWYSGYGKVTVIDHGCGVESLYAHQSAQAVQVGQSVAAGDVIGRVGSTGIGTGPHLHFEVWENGARTSPWKYLK